MDSGRDRAFPNPALAQDQHRTIAFGNGGNRQMHPFLKGDKGFHLPFPVMSRVAAYHEVIRYPPTYSNAGSKLRLGHGKGIPQGVPAVSASSGNSVCVG